MKNHILTLFKGFERLTIKSIISKLRIYDREEILKELYSLELEGLVYFDGDAYMKVPIDFYLIHGIVRLSNRGNFYIIHNKEKIILDRKELNGVKEGDAVFVEPIKSNSKKQNKSKIVRVISKEINQETSFIVKAEIHKKNNSEWFIYVDDKRVFIPDEYINGACNGDICSVQITEKGKRKTGRVVNIIYRSNISHLFICHKTNDGEIWSPTNTVYDEFTLLGNHSFDNGDVIEGEVNYEEKTITFVKKIDRNGVLESQVEQIASSHGFERDFSELENKELANLDTTISDSDLKNRVDLRKLKTFTIDPKTAKDMDDALSIEKLSDRYRLYVHISDVSHYVKFTSELFKCALKRGFSAYAYGEVWPMLDPILSDDLCSLSESNDRLCKTDIIDIDFEGNIIDYRFVRSIINSDKKMNYDDVNKFLENLEVVPSYEDYLHELKVLADLSELLDKRNDNRGVLKITSEELEFDIKNGVVNGVKSRHFGIAEKLVANTMGLANELRTNMLKHVDAPYCYRNHEPINALQLRALKKKLPSRTHYINKMLSASNPKLISKLINMLLQSCNDDELEYISKLVLTSLNKAEYGATNKGHYGLGLEAYGTHTSGIRKCSDIINQMIADDILDANYGSLKKWDDILPDICSYLSEREKEAELVEEDVDNLLLMDYVKQFIDEELEGHVTYISENNIYFKTHNKLRGIVPIKGKYAYDKTKNFVYDKNSNDSFKVGDKVLLKIANADNSKNGLTFKIVNKILKKEKIK